MIDATTRLEKTPEDKIHTSVSGRSHLKADTFLDTIERIIATDGKSPKHEKLRREFWEKAYLSMDPTRDESAIAQSADESLAEWDKRWSPK